MGGIKFMDVLTGQLSPFARIVVLLALLLGFGTNLATVLNPPDTEDRYRGRDAAEEWATHKLQHTHESTGIKATLSVLRAEHAAHLQHSARYTAIIDRLQRDEEKNEDALNEHLQDDH